MAKVTFTAVPRLKTGFAMSHLQVAAHSALEAYEIEQANATTPGSAAIWEEVTLSPPLSFAVIA
jgi:hypothetical protein